MSQEQERGPEPQQNQPPVARAEEFVDRMGRSIGLFAGLTGQRLYRAATVIRQEMQHATQPVTSRDEQSNQPEIARTEESGRHATQKTTERAEQTVDQAAQRLGQLSAVASYQVQKTVARIREEAEDIWVEAQHLRHPNDH